MTTEMAVSLANIITPAVGTEIINRSHKNPPAGSFESRLTLTQD